jgi:hypothetical protein
LLDSKCALPDDPVESSKSLDNKYWFVMWEWEMTEKLDVSQRLHIEDGTILLIEYKPMNRSSWAHIADTRQKRDLLHLQPKDWIDAKDTDGKFFESTVVECKAPVDGIVQEVKVHFNGWQSKWDGNKNKKNISYKYTILFRTFIPVPCYSCFIFFICLFRMVTCCTYWSNS